MRWLQLAAWAAAVLLLFLPFSCSEAPRRRPSPDPVELSHLSYRPFHPHAQLPLPSFFTAANDIHLHAGVLTINEADILASKAQHDEEANPAHRHLLSTLDAPQPPQHSSPSIPHRVRLSTGAVFDLRIPTSSSPLPSLPARPLHTFSPSSVHAFSLSSPTPRSTSSPPLHQYLVHIKSPITPNVITSINRSLHPYSLSSYLPHSSFTLLSAAYVAATARILPDVLFVAEIHAEWKGGAGLSERLVDRMRGHQAEQLWNVEGGEGEGWWDEGEAGAGWRNNSHSATRRGTHHQVKVDLVSGDRRRTAAWCEEVERYWAGVVRALDPPPSSPPIRCGVSSASQALVEMPHDFTFLNVSALPTDDPTPTSPSLAPSFLSFFLSSLSHHPLVHFLSLVHHFAPLNKHARFVTQSDFIGEDHHYLTPAYSLGLDGAGQVIALGDTGVDYDSCYFHDPERPVPLNTFDASHRKILTYITVDDPKSKQKKRAVPGDHMGHGTHTAGSVAGHAIDPLIGSSPMRPPLLVEVSKYNGIAYKARLIVHDFLIPGDNNLYVPENVYDDYLTKVVEMGAHLSSNSWGDDQGIYDEYSQAVDRFLYEHPTHLMVMAAGNEGSKGLATIGTPACAKNVMTVGASLNHPDSFAELGYNSAILVEEPEEWRGVIRVMPADFGTEFFESLKHVNSTIVLANPLDACSPLQFLNAKGAIVVAQRGSCKYYVKAKHVEDAGGVLLLLVNNEGGAALQMTTDDEQPVIGIPSAMVARDHGVHLIDKAEFIRIRITFPVVYDDAEYNENRLSHWSSRGPTQDGRLKPDLVAPGEYIQSAGSTNDLQDHQCGNPHEKSKRTVVPMEGTSMATPIAAGTAALLRQFFVEGKYRPPTGRADVNIYDEEYPKGVAWQPSSSLLKGMLAHGTAPVGGKVKLKTGKDATVLPPPSVYQGHGRIQLNQVINFPVQRDGRTVLPFQLFVDDNSTLLSLQHAQYCFRVRDDSVPLKATLAWIDRPGALHSSFILVNQFDLAVAYYNVSALNATRVNGGQVWVGNDRSRDDQTPPQWDTNNNLEKVSIAHPLPGLYQVVVRATQLPSAVPERYSLIVTGQFDAMEDTQCPVDVYCPSACSGHGRCNRKSCPPLRPPIPPSSSNSSATARSLNDGVCECDPHWASADCSVSATPLSASAPLTDVIIHPQQWAYFYIDAPSNAVSLNLTITRVTSVGDPDFYATSPLVPGYPTLAYFDLKDTQYDPSMKEQPATHHFGWAEERMVPGTYMLGVWGYCCDKPTISIAVSLQVDASKVDVPLEVQLPSATSCQEEDFEAGIVEMVENRTITPMPTASSPAVVKLLFHLRLPLNSPALSTSPALSLETEWKAVARTVGAADDFSLRLLSLTPVMEGEPGAPRSGDRAHNAAVSSVSTEEVQAKFMVTALLLSNRSFDSEQDRLVVAIKLMAMAMNTFAALHSAPTTTGSDGSSSDLTGATSAAPASALLTNATFLLACEASTSYLAPQAVPSCDRSDQQAAADALIAPAPLLPPPSTSSPSASLFDRLSAWWSAQQSMSEVSTPVLLLLLVLSLAAFYLAYRLCTANKGLTEAVEESPDTSIGAVDDERHAADEGLTSFSSSSNSSSSSSPSFRLHTPHSPTTLSELSTSSRLSRASVEGQRPTTSAWSWTSLAGLFGGGRDATHFTAISQQQHDEHDDDEDGEGVEEEEDGEEGDGHAGHDGANPQSEVLVDLQHGSTVT